MYEVRSITFLYVRQRFMCFIRFNYIKKGLKTFKRFIQNPNTKAGLLTIIDISLKYLVVHVCVYVFYFTLQLVTFMTCFPLSKLRDLGKRDYLAY